MWHIMTKEEIRRKLRTDFENGLTEDEAKKRHEQYGANELKDKKKKNILVKFLMQFNDFMIIVLIIAAIVSGLIAFIEKNGEYYDSIIIIAIVFFNAIMGLVQESKAEKALEDLKKLSAPNAIVKRDGIIKEISSSEVVPGDIIMLETGNYVPADCRILKCSNMKIEESALTRRSCAGH